jgi:hypothetical protein
MDHNAMPLTLKLDCPEDAVLDRSPTTIPTTTQIATSALAGATLSLPDRDQLYSEFETAILELDEFRADDRLLTDFYLRIGSSVFDAGYRALEEFCTARAAQGKAAHRRLQVVSAPVGSGKTSFSQAFIAAVVRCWFKPEQLALHQRFAERDTTAPFGCLYVTDQMTQADELYRELNLLLPGKVAVWTTDHSTDCKEPKKVTDPNRPRFSKDDLQRFPVAIVTHAFFGGKDSHKARQVLHGGKLQPRALTVIDEQINSVTPFDIKLSEAELVRELVQKDEKHSATTGPYMDELLQFMCSRAFAGPDIEKPTDDEQAWAVAEKLQWFTTSEAAGVATYVKSLTKDPAVKHYASQLFGFAKALANGYAFIARAKGGEKGTQFVGYENTLDIPVGAVLLDATADIDGMSQLCLWREHTPIPQARYDKLSVVNIPPHTKVRLSNYLTNASNMKAYVDWMVRTIKAQIAPGQYGEVAPIV